MNILMYTLLYFAATLLVMITGIIADWLSDDREKVGCGDWHKNKNGAFCKFWEAHLIPQRENAYI